MADDEPLYFCILQRADQLLPAKFRADTDLAKLTEWADNGGKGFAAPAPSPTADSGRAIDTKSMNLGRLMSRIVESSHQQYEMTAIVTMLRQVFPFSAAKTELIDDILATADKIVNNEGYLIYKLDEYHTGLVLKFMEKTSRTTSGLSHLPNALLLSMVAVFDGQMSDAVRAMYRTTSDKLKSGQKQVPLTKVLSASSLDEIVEDAISDEIYQFSRNGHDEQVKYIEDTFDIDVRKNWKRWPDLIEVFERRNLVAHGEGSFTSRYVAICARHGHKGSDKLLGTKIKITGSYLRQSLNILSEFSILLVFSLWRKHLPSEEIQAFSKLNNAVVDLIVQKRPQLAVHLSGYALALKGTSIKEATRLRFVINLANAHLHNKNEEAAKKILDAVDWSAAADNFKICVAALRNDINQITTLLPLIKASNSIDADQFRQWPVFNQIKDNETFQWVFYDTFKEPFKITKPIKTTDAAATVVDNIESIENAAPISNTKH